MGWCGALQNIAGTEPVVPTRNSHRRVQESRRSTSPSKLFGLTPPDLCTMCTWGDFLWQRAPIGFGPSGLMPVADALRIRDA